MPEFEPYRELVLLGSALHDSPYYLRDGNFEEVSARLHGTDGEDTLKPIAQMLEQSRKFPLEKELFALAVGMLSHIALDQVFHPAIYYLTGNYYADSREERSAARWAHRAFEVAIDLGLEESARQLRLGSLVRRAESVLRELTPFLPEANVLKGGWIQAIRAHSRIDALSRSRVAGSILRPLSFHPTIAEGMALSVLRKHPLELSERLEYRNPVTGEYSTKTATEMLNEAVERTLSLVRDFQEGRHETLVGASLNFDLPQVSSADAKYFAELSNRVDLQRRLFPR